MRRAKLVNDASITAMDNRYFSRAATWSRLDERLVVHDTFSAQALPTYFAEEFSSQPPEVRKAQMEADGLLGSEQSKE